MADQNRELSSFETDHHPCPMAVYEFESPEALDLFCATGDPGEARRIG